VEGRQAIDSPVGREEILSRLAKRVEALKKGYRQNVTLVGPRFIGKTFLLRHFLERMGKDPEILPIYIPLIETDFDGFVERWLGALLQGFLSSQGISFPEEFQQLVRISRTFIPKTLERMKEVKKFAPQKKTALAFRELLGLTATLHEETGKKILLMLDEFQCLGALELADPFGLFGKEMMIQKDTLYLATSSEPHRKGEIFNDRLSLLFGNFEVIELCPLKLDDIRRWIEESYSEIEIPDSDIRLLSHLLDNHPHYFHIFLEEAKREWVHRDQAGWSREFLFQVLAETLFLEQGALNRHFEFEIQTLTRLGRCPRAYARTLLAVASGRAKLFQIMAYLGRKGSETKKVLQRLVGEGILEKKGSFYRLPDPLFRFWLKNVFYIKDREVSPWPERARAQFRSRLEEEVGRIEEEDRRDLTTRMEGLLREFRNDVVEVGQKKMRCPAFFELASRPTNGRYFPIFGRTPKGRWFCQVFRDLVTEGDVAGFQEEMKRFRRGAQRKLMFALGGIELNAKLMAQEGDIQIWDLENLNTLLDLYGKVKVIF